jgi:hypothetical protein
MVHNDQGLGLVGQYPLTFHLTSPECLFRIFTAGIN